MDDLENKRAKELLAEALAKRRKYEGRGFQQGTIVFDKKNGRQVRVTGFNSGNETVWASSQLDPEKGTEKDLQEYNPDDLELLEN